MRQGATVGPASSRRIPESPPGPIPPKPAVQLAAAQAAPLANRRVTPPVDTEVQLISVAVTDPLNRFVTGLEENNFKLFEDGVEQRIFQFSADLPISVGILFHTSSSMWNLQPS